MNERLQVVTFEELLENPKKYLKPQCYWWLYANPSEWCLGEVIYRISLDRRERFVIEELVYHGEQESPHYTREYPHLRKDGIQRCEEMDYFKGKTGVVSAERPENIKVYQIGKR